MAPFLKGVKMPRKVDINTGLTKKWNLYVNEIEHAEFVKALSINNKPKCQSAAIRAFMKLYCSDTEVQAKINNIIDDFIIYKKDGSQSIL